jgi:formate dehydrogenase iron-sulfur subunit
MPATSTEGPPGREPPRLTFLEELLAEQQQLQTPVARFAEQASPAVAAARYTDLIPLTLPGPGEQYAFEVDLDTCTGCKACVAACHALNGLDDDETWRDIGLLVSPEPRHPFSQTITTACHHCADPACLHGCPVLAYEKDPVTGIVRHLDDQCIGCNYCVLMCPYEVPKYNAARGIVRKCDMCHGRLAAGEAPACAQACPTEAIRIVTVTTHRGANGRPQADTSAFLAAGPDPSLTQPTTRYLSRRGLPANLVAADAESLQPEPAHSPLVVMLTLVQLAVGGLAVAALSGRAGGPALPGLLAAHGRLTALPPAGGLVILAWLAGAVGLAASFLHLGQPLRAWRVFLGLRRSWMSREIIVLSGWFLLATAALFLPALAPAGALAGLAGLTCSVMVYVATGRDSWRLTRTLPLFFGGALVLGLAARYALVAGALSAAGPLALAVLAKVGLELRAFRPLDEEDEAPTPARRAARLLAGPLSLIQSARIATALAGGLALPFFIAIGAAPAGAAWVAAGLVLTGEVLERLLFFRAVAAPKMPGIARP